MGSLKAWAYRNEMTSLLLTEGLSDETEGPKHSKWSQINRPRMRMAICLG